MRETSVRVRRASIRGLYGEYVRFLVQVGCPWWRCGEMVEEL